MIEIDAERQIQARRYSLTRLGLRAVSLATSLTGLALLGPLGLAPALRDATNGPPWFVHVAAFFAILGAAGFVAGLPLAYYRSFVLPHRYGLSNQSLSAWAIDLFKGAGLGVVLGGITLEVLYAFLRLDPSRWWIWASIAYTLFSVVLTTLAPLAVVPLFFRLQPLRNRELESAITRLAARAGAHVAEVCEINLSSKTSAANAAVIGLGRTRKIVLGDTLVDDFPAEEIEVVVAHELGHHVHRDLGKGIALGAGLSLVGFWLVSFILHAAIDKWHFAGVWDLGAFSVLTAGLGAWSFVSATVERAFSRRMESAADFYSLDLTGLGRAFVASEVRLVNQNLAWLRPPAAVEWLFYTHPAPWRRIAMGEAYIGAQSSPGEMTSVRRPSTE